MFMLGFWKFADRSSVNKMVYVFFVNWIQTECHFFKTTYNMLMCWQFQIKSLWVVQWF